MATGRVSALCCGWCKVQQPPAEESELIQAIHEPVRSRRARQSLQALVSALADQAEHPDWPHVFDYLRLIRTYPASALDIVQHLAHVPEAMILALLRSADEEFDLVWSLAEQLPFSWYLVPVAAWLRAAERHFGALRVGLGDYDADWSMLWGTFWEFRQRVTCRQPFFQQVCDWLGRAAFPWSTDGEQRVGVGTPCSVNSYREDSGIRTGATGTP